MESEAAGARIDLIIGLGNIGKRYEGTRHNIGFEVLDQVAKLLGVTTRHEERLYDWCRAKIVDYPVVLAWPKTLMNRSGWAASELLDRFESEPRQMLAIVDDFNLPLGGLRFRPQGSDGGHNGLASLIEELQTEDFPRLRIGIGEPPVGEDVVDFVLGKITSAEREVVEPIVRLAAEAAIFAVDHHFEEVMSRYNRNPAQSE